MTIYTVTLNTDDIQYTIEVSPEYDSVRDHFAFGAEYAEEEKALVAKIEQAVEDGDEWAWCVVQVTATLGPYSYSETLGACSYKHEGDFRESDYFDDMKADATDGLIKDIVEHGGVAR